jgi:hypothetical protein
MIPTMGSRTTSIARYTYRPTEGVIRTCGSTARQTRPAAESRNMTMESVILISTGRAGAAP